MRMRDACMALVAILLEDLAHLGFLKRLGYHQWRTMESWSAFFWRIYEERLREVECWSHSLWGSLGRGKIRLRLYGPHRRSQWIFQCRIGVRAVIVAFEWQLWWPGTPWGTILSCTDIFWRVDRRFRCRVIVPVLVLLYCMSKMQMMVWLIWGFTMYIGLFFPILYYVAFNDDYCVLTYRPTVLACILLDLTCVTSWNLSISSKLRVRSH